MAEFDADNVSGKEDSLTDLVRNTCEELRLAFDSVVIIATKERKGDCMRHSSYSGNYYTCMGSTQAWIDNEKLRGIRLPEGDND